MKKMVEDHEDHEESDENDEFFLDFSEKINFWMKKLSVIFIVKLGEGSKLC